MFSNKYLFYTHLTGIINYNYLKYFCCIVILSFFSLLNAQVRLGEWKSLTSILNVREIVGIDNIIYSATSGGIYKIDNNSSSIITTTEGLRGVDLGTITTDFQKNLWIGGNNPNGFIQIYDPIKELSINIFEFGLSSILDIKSNNFVSWALFADGQELGLMKFIYEDKWNYRDSYINYPDNSGSINCFDVNDSMVFIGMSGGLYSCKISDNMKDPNNWNEIIVNFENSITSMDLIDNELFFTTKNSLYKYNFVSNELVEIEFSNNLENANNLVVFNEEIWLSDEIDIYGKIFNNEIQLQSNLQINSINYLFNNQLVAGTNHGFLFIQQDSEEEYYFDNLIPNAPATGKFSAITILDDGRLVGGSNQGISIYNGQGWRNILEVKSSGTLSINEKYDYGYFIGDTVPYDFGEYIADIEQGPDGLVYCAIRGSRVSYGNPQRWSGGVIIIDVDNPENISVIDTTYLSYHTTSGNSRPYQVVLDIEFDNDGNLWIVNPYCINGNNPLHVKSSNDIWKHYGSSETTTLISQSPVSISFDSWDRVWLSAFQAEEANLGLYPNGGIYYLNYNGMPYSPIDFSWNIIQYSGTVWSLAMGRRDRLYYLTPTGLNYFDLKNGDNPIINENSNAYFPNISFGKESGIKVDNNGNIWTYSPTQGIHVLLENTTYWPDINGFREHNSPLLSDEITDIEFDYQRKLAYIATNKGINILRIPYGDSITDYDNIKIFPSPFYLPSEKMMIVDGLKYNSSMLITSLNGEVITHIESSGINIDGDQLSWDGKDNDGDYVSSGVYLLLIYGEDGSRIEQKITVIKQ